MKSLVKYSLSIIIVVTVFAANIFSQTDLFKTYKTNKSFTRNIDSNKVVAPDDNRPWARSLYIAGAFGAPQGARFELGYNFGSDFSLAATFGIQDNWSRDPAQGTLGITGKIHFLQIQTLDIYILLGTGGTMSLFGGDDSFTLVHLGSRYSLIKWLQLCPELGYVFTSKHISGGKSLFGGSIPEIRENKSRLGISISLEVDLRQIF